MDALRTVLVPINRDGYRFIAAFAVVALLLFWLWEPLGWLGVLATAWCAYFFRDPPRVVPLREGLLVSPADGTVASVEKAVPPAELGMDPVARTRIGIFLNIFDVHVNRIPDDGEVTGLAYRPGKFINANLDKASEDNERQSIRLRTGDGKEIAVVQIAGLVARRIVCDLYEGQQVRRGERIGLIRFGSRLDVYLDELHTPLVMTGQKVIAGETVIADARAQEPARRGETR